jgi:glutathione S-transferase
MITVHHLNHSRSQRVLWLLEELELPYEIKFYERDPVTRLAPPSLKAVHPLGKSPVLSTTGRPSPRPARSSITSPTSRAGGFAPKPAPRIACAGPTGCISRRGR